MKAQNSTQSNEERSIMDHEEDGDRSETPSKTATRETELQIQQILEAEPANMQIWQNKKRLKW